MKKLLMILVGMAFTLALASSAMAGYTINLEGFDHSDPYGIPTTEYNVTIDTFDADRPGWAYSGDFDILQGDKSGKASAPYISTESAKDTTYYLSVPKNSSTGSVTVSNFGSSDNNYLGLLWGSIDTYNTIEFKNGNEIVGSIVGTDILSLTLGTSGDQVNPLTNGYVNIFTDNTFDSIVITSTSYAFELDNLAIGNVPVPGPGETVPVPGAFLLGGLGVGVVGWMKRRRAL